MRRLPEAIDIERFVQRTSSCSCVSLSLTYGRLCSRQKQYTPRNPVHTPGYYPATPLPLFDSQVAFEKFDTDTLFFIFYYQQGTYQQYLAARELKNRSWRYHKKVRRSLLARTALSRWASHDEPIDSHSDCCVDTVPDVVPTPRGAEGGTQARSLSLSLALSLSRSRSLIECWCADYERVRARHLRVL